MAHVRRNAHLRTRATDNNENAAQAKTVSTGTGKASLVQQASNMLKTGARRAALSDVTNKAPVAAPAARQGKSMDVVVAVGAGGALARPPRRELSQGALRPLQQAAPLVEDMETEQSEASDTSDMDDEPAEMDLDGRMGSATRQIVMHALERGEPVRAPVSTQEDRATLRRVADEFVDDWEEWADISMVQEYADDIFTYMHTLEKRLMPSATYMENQVELEWKMRGILIDWLVQVHGRFHLLPETLFLTINYIDRFLSAKTVSLQKLQLVGATALFVASKYEEIQCPSVSEVIYMVDNGYTAEELLMAERFMIGMLDFELGWPGPMSFLRRISKADDYDIDTRTIAKYLLEALLMSELFIATPPSFAAAMANFFARKVLGRPEIWTDAHVFFSTYTTAQIEPAVHVMVSECLEDGRTKHGAIFEKYADRKHKKVSLFVEQWLARREA